MNHPQRLTLAALALLAALPMTGCMSMEGAVRNSFEHGHKLATRPDGIVYGIAFPHNMSVAATDMKTACELAGQRDPRCAPEEAVKYNIHAVVPRIGYSEGNQIAYTLIPKEFEAQIKDTPDHIYVRHGVFAKVRVEPQRFATFIELVENNKETGCYWRGFPRAGGTVCPSRGWDFRKDLTDDNITHKLR